tara:strand:- start:808 stop:1209 length:402 start_codon:yes stop_codon:yes gene_type:complete
MILEQEPRVSFGQSEMQILREVERVARLLDRKPCEMSVQKCGVWHVTILPVRSYQRYSKGEIADARKACSQIGQALEEWRGEVEARLEPPECSSGPVLIWRRHLTQAIRHHGMHVRVAYHLLDEALEAIQEEA